MNIVNRYIGHPVERIEDLRFLRGRGTYVDDVTREGMLHAAILRSQVAHGRVGSIDASAARAYPGVCAVITAQNFNSGTVPQIPMRLQVSEGVERFFQQVIVEERVRYVGEPLAMVVAESAAQAEDALEAIVVDIEPLPVVSDRRASIEDTTLLFDAAGTNLAKIFYATLGDAARAFRDAPHVLRETFRTQRHSASPMETRGLVAEWDDASQRMTIWGAAKVPFFNRRILSGLIGLPEHAIRMVENDVGGGFGARGEFYPEDYLVPFAARLLNQPVKWIEDRRKNLLSMNHARDMDAELEVSFLDDGTITGLRGDVYVDVGSYLRTNGLTAVNNVVQAMSGPYRIRNIGLRSYACLTNKTPCGTYRGPGRFEGAFFFERLLDLVAAKLDIDRVEIRRRNLITSADMPYQLAAIKPVHPYAITSCDSGDYRVTLDRCLKEFGWDGKKATFDGKFIDGRYHGVSVGCFIEGGAAGPKENARLTIRADGTVSVFVGSSALGQGLETAFSQIAADALDMPLYAIDGVFHGSTDYVDEGFGSFHSRASVMGGSAILNAADNLKDKLCVIAAEKLGVDRASLRCVEGRIVDAGGTIYTLPDLGISDCTADGTFVSSKNTYAYGAHAAHVAVDAGTGGVKVLDYFAIEDVGRIINPDTLHGQLLGSLVQGLGSTFLEELVHNDNGQLLTGSLADYLMPTATDFPRLRGMALEDYPSPNNPLGTKGAGEGGIIPVGGVIANAIVSALSSFGVRLNTLPLSPQNVWRAIEEARSKTLETSLASANGFSRSST